MESLEAELRKLRRENEVLRAGGTSFAPFNSSPSVSSASLQHYPTTPVSARHQAVATPGARPREAGGPNNQNTTTVVECKGCASKAKSYESLVKKTRDVFQHYRTVVYELTGSF